MTILYYARRFSTNVVVFVEISFVHSSFLVRFTILVSQINTIIQ